MSDWQKDRMVLLAIGFLEVLVCSYTGVRPFLAVLAVVAWFILRAMERMGRP